MIQGNHHAAEPGTTHKSNTRNMAEPELVTFNARGQRNNDTRQCNDERWYKRHD